MTAPAQPHAAASLLLLMLSSCVHAFFTPYPAYPPPAYARNTQALRRVRASALPAEVQAAVKPFVSKYSQKEVVALWKAFRTCYASDDAAVKAAKQNPSVLCPLYATPELIRSTYKVLLKRLGSEDAASVLRQNPAVLTCGRMLEDADPDEIKRAAMLRQVLDRISPEALSAVLGVLIIAIIAKVAAATGAR
uniref:Uncharacterized protein n=1 Tax=Chrysotila carterae TaxID=13221 RepID=A0A7S4ERJ3_CHRCT|mmetsp:Transcript_32473/g.62545  ORF Transcript_32473/g.62545 Transcript_32473/m.62545 type:complete len:192 (-) Transcript_32473:480-1055(-)